MNNINSKAFTLVELLVVITILAIISVVAYQNFGWAVDKAVSGRKISDVAVIEKSLSQFKIDNNYYPSVWKLDENTNKWWYSSNNEASPSNTLKVTMQWAEIAKIESASWGWKVMNLESPAKQIWAKWTISQTELWKKYLSKDLYDPEVWDLKENENKKKLIEYWLGRYVYAVYKKPNSADWWDKDKTWSFYNIAFTVKKNQSDTYITKIVWDYDKGSCFDNSENCPDTLIWSKENILKNEQEQWKSNSWTPLSDFSSKSSNQWIPYPVNDFE